MLCSVVAYIVLAGGVEVAARVVGVVSDWRDVAVALVSVLVVVMKPVVVVIHM